MAKEETQSQKVKTFEKLPALKVKSQKMKSFKKRAAYEVKVRHVNQVGCPGLRHPHGLSELHDVEMQSQKVKCFNELAMQS